MIIKLEWYDGGSWQGYSDGSERDIITAVAMKWLWSWSGMMVVGRSGMMMVGGNSIIVMAFVLWWCWEWYNAGGGICDKRW